MSKQKINRDHRAQQLTWRRVGAGWVLLLDRKRVGSVLPDETYPNMWRPVLSGGRLGNMGNLSWAKSTSLDAAIREIEFATKSANAPSKSQENRGVLNGRAPLVRSDEDPATQVGLWTPPARRAAE